MARWASAGIGQSWTVEPPGALSLEGCQIVCVCVTVLWLPILGSKVRGRGCVCAFRVHRNRLRGAALALGNQCDDCFPNDTPGSQSEQMRHEILNMFAELIEMFREQNVKKVESFSGNFAKVFQVFVLLCIYNNIFNPLIIVITLFSSAF